MADSFAHARHDALVVAGSVERRGRPPAIIALCAACATLHADLLALRAAIPAAAIPTRPRDYRLSLVDAARLRAPAWRRWLATLGSSSDAITRPLAVGFATLGVVGLLLTTVPAGFPAGGAAGMSAGPTPETRSAQLHASAGPAIPGGAEIAPIATIGDTATEDARRNLANPARPDALVALSLAMLGTGGAIFLARRVLSRGGQLR